LFRFFDVYTEIVKVGIMVSRKTLNICPGAEDPDMVLRGLTPHGSTRQNNGHCHWADGNIDLTFLWEFETRVRENVMKRLEAGESWIEQTNEEHENRNLYKIQV
jgi:ketopantoate reductase